MMRSERKSVMLMPRTVKAIIVVGVLAGIVSGALLVYTPLGGRLLAFIGVADTADCG